MTLSFRWVALVNRKNSNRFARRIAMIDCRVHEHDRVGSRRAGELKTPAEKPLNGGRGATREN